MANEIQVDCVSGLTLYAIIRDRTGRVWHPASQDFEQWGTDSHTATNYAIALTDKSGNRYVGDFDANIPAGDYAVQVFDQDSAAPAETDDLVGGQTIAWTGLGELTALKYLANKAVHDKTAGTYTYYDSDGQTILLTHLSTEDAFGCTRTPQV